MFVGLKESHSGIYLLPNLFTTVSLFSAYYAIVASMRGQFETAVIAIFIGMIADGLDGRIARMTNTQSAFGAQYDSLSDMVTFGVAPSLLLFEWALVGLGKIGWLIAFIYTACVAIRLARFNVRLDVVDKRYFQGLACPAGAALISSFIWLCVQNNWHSHSLVVATAILCLVVSAAMVSSLPYNSFKQIDFRGKVPFLYLFLIVLILVALWLYPAEILFISFALYLLSGPWSGLRFMRRRSRAR